MDYHAKNLEDANESVMGATLRILNGLAGIAKDQWGGDLGKYFVTFYEGMLERNGAVSIDKGDYERALEFFPMVNKLHPTASTPKWVESRPHPERLPGNCYNNSRLENEITKNPMAVALYLDLKTRNVDHIYLHAINYDPRTKTYYDRTNTDSKGGFAYIIMEGDALAKRFKKMEAFEDQMRKTRSRAYAAGGKERAKQFEKGRQLCAEHNKLEFSNTHAELYRIVHEGKSLFVKSMGNAHHDSDDGGLVMEVVA